MNPPPFHQAIVRTISRSLADCELLHLPRQSFNLARARAQHEGYVAALEEAGLHVTVLPEEPGLPDVTFVEDPAVVFDEFLLLGRMGVSTRQPEVESLALALSGLRPVRQITPPGTLEGGDILQADRTLFAGLSSRAAVQGIQRAPRGHRRTPKSRSRPDLPQFGLPLPMNRLAAMEGRGESDAVAIGVGHTKEFWS